MLIYNNTIVTDEKQLANIFNNHYVNIIEKSTCENDMIRNIITKYENNPSITENNEEIHIILL